MAKASSLIAKVDRILNKVNATSKTVYKREYTRTGGDPLIGKAATVTKTDKKLSPVPAISSITQDDLLAISGSSQYNLSDLIMTVSMTAVSKKDLSNPNVTFVLKEGSVEEEYSVLGYTASMLDGSVIVYNVVLRSKAR